METPIAYGVTHPFLKDAGITGKIILEHDWSRTALGSIIDWPLSLRTTLANMLHSAFPMLLFWGPELTGFYNDALRPSLAEDRRDSAMGRKAKDMWPEMWDFIGPLLITVIETGKPVWFEDHRVPFFFDGELKDFYWTFSYSPAYGDKGEIAGVVVTCMETTDTVLARMKASNAVVKHAEEMAQAHESLLQAYAYLQTIINQFKEPLQVLEPVWKDDRIVDFRYKLTNASYSAYANSTPDHLQDKKVSDFFPGYLQTSSFTKNVEVFQSGIPDTWDIHYNVDGLDLHNRMSALKLDGELLVHFTDFTEVTQLQKTLERKVSELERSNRQLEEFTHAASHDLKEPIRKIQVFTDILKAQLTTKLSDSEVSTLEKIERASQRMGLLIEDLLLYTHVSQQPLLKEAVDLNDTVKQVFEDLDLDIQQKQAAIHVAQLPVVQGYRRQLQQLFQNLISNSLKYSKKDAPARIDITTSTSIENGIQYYLIEVADNGIGFEQRYADRIFQMFTRLHNKAEYTGTGVGLSIVKKIIENHQGTINAYSTPGQGTTFKIFLPSV